VTYRLAILPGAERDVRRLPPAILRRVDARLQALTEQPRPPGVRPIEGTQGGLRMRVGDYRILYHVDDAERLITIVRVRHRRDVYRGL
jgi:mRNA interferase RelE/StbE